MTEAQTMPFQKRVQAWMMECFSMEICRDTVERNHRFLEESLELVQSLGCTRSEAHQLVDYVFGRPAGEPYQETGGVKVTLAALCLAADTDMDAAGETELARVWTKIEQIRAKQAAKPKHSPLPECAPTAAAQPVAWTNKAQLGFLDDPACADIPMAMWSKTSPASPIPLYEAIALPPAQEAMKLPDIPDDDADFTPDLARKIIEKYQDLLRARSPDSPGRQEIERIIAPQYFWQKDNTKDGARIYASALAAKLEARLHRDRHGKVDPELGISIDGDLCADIFEAVAALRSSAPVGSPAVSQTVHRGNE